MQGSEAISRQKGQKGQTSKFGEILNCPIFEAKFQII